MVLMNQSRKDQKETIQRTRFFYMDNLRIFLTILVILHHAAIAYGGSGDWAIKETASDSISPIIFTLFNAINQSYFMAAFFLLAGYFTPQSYEKKGPLKFLEDRVIRLGIPLALYTPLIVPINTYIIQNFAIDRPQNLSLFDILRYQYTHFSIQFGHLWFLLALLIFAGIYVVFRMFVDQYAPQTSIHFFRDKFPPNVVLFLSIGFLSILTFAVRLVFPVGVWFLHVQLAHFVHYTFCFYCGVLAYRGDWFRRISGALAQHWGILSLFTILLAPVILILGGALESGSVDVFLGGMTWQAFSYAVWESVLLIGILIWLLYVFRERITYHGRLSKALAANVYTVYIIHQPILIALNVALLSIAIPTTVKFILASFLAVFLCFTLSHFIIRRIPYAKRVLG